MRLSFILGAILSTATLVLAAPAVMAQTGGAAGQTGGYQTGTGSQYGTTGDQAYGGNQWGSQYGAGGFQQGGMYGGQMQGYGQYRGQTGPYARDLGYGTYGRYGSPYTQQSDYRGTQYGYQPGGTYGGQTGGMQYGQRYGYSGYPQYYDQTMRGYQTQQQAQRFGQGWQGYGYAGAPRTQYGGYGQQFEYQRQPSDTWGGWRSPTQSWQTYQGQQRYYPDYQQSGFQSGAYYGQPGWQGSGQSYYDYSGYGDTRQGTWRGQTQQPYGYSGYESQSYMNRGVYYDDDSSGDDADFELRHGWYGPYYYSSWANCPGDGCPRYRTVGHTTCDQYGRPCYNPLNRYNGSIPHESFER